MGAPLTDSTVINFVRVECILTNESYELLTIKNLRIFRAM